MRYYEISLDDEIQDSEEKAESKNIRKKRKSLPLETKKIVYERYEGKCMICKATKDLCYHHLVEVADGGTDDPSNLSLVCHFCHKILHAQKMSDAKRRQFAKDSGMGGRPPIASREKDSDVFDQFINGEIGNMKANEILGYSPGVPLAQRPEFIKYAKNKGIKEVHNKVDCAAVTSYSGLVDGYPVGYIVMEDGTQKTMYYKDTGENNVKYRKRKVTLPRLTYHNKFGGTELIKVDTTKLENSLEHDDFAEVKLAIDHLGKFEDEKQEKSLFESPCKIGDILYHINNSGNSCNIDEYKVTGFTIEVQKCANTLLDKERIKNEKCYIKKNSVNSEWYLKREKAEKELMRYEREKRKDI